ncbi:hypothetical protein T10_9286 [Trichinella papuae]|uniref:Uncharacterized protein n=1 Tax=Trichinella papuae TaxID=268474 RepID=A0A0V1M133_9BILA|nr:hypothetical protein T10_9286 [Trichinella papuae]
MKSNFVLSADNFILFDCDDLLDQPRNSSVVLSKDVNVKLSSEKYAVKLLVLKKLDETKNVELPMSNNSTSLKGTLGCPYCIRFNRNIQNAENWLRSFTNLRKTLKSLLAY